MTKFVRCIEGHVYNSDKHEACPVCGAVPGDEASIVVDPPRSDQSEREGKATPRAFGHGGQLSNLLRSKWLILGVVVMLAGASAIYALTSGETQDVVDEAADTEELAAEQPTETDADSPDDEVANADEGRVDEAEEESQAQESDDENESETPQNEEVADQPDNAVPTPSGETATLRERARKHFNRKDYDSAIADYTDIIRTGNGESSDYTFRGMAYHFKGQHEAALADYNRAIDFENHDARAHFSRAALHRDKGDIDEALKDLNEAIEEHRSTDPYHYVERAFMFMRQSSFDRAVADFDKGIELLDKDKTATPNIKAAAHYQRGLAKLRGVHERREFCATLVGAGDCNYPQSLKDPLKDFKKAIELEPNYAAAYLETGLILAELGDREEALDAYTSAIKVNPTYSLAYANRCLVYNLMDQKDLALADCNDAIRHDAQNPLAWAYRGTVFGSKRGRKNRNLAIADFRKALEVDPNNYLARESLKKFGVKP